MPGHKIPFEIHVTTGFLPTDREQEFSKYCESVGAKALLIELSRGEFTQQPMLSTIVYTDRLDSVLSTATTLSESLIEQKFGVKRLKIEVPAINADMFLDEPGDFDRYYEWHGKITYENTEELQEICQKHKVHLSINALKNEVQFRFITLREYGNKQRFEQRIHLLLKDLKTGNWEVNKQQSEYCIYDNNSYLDKGWLPE